MNVSVNVFDANSACVMLDGSMRERLLFYWHNIETCMEK